MPDIARHWYQSSLTIFSFLLLPLAGLFYLIITMRRFLYKIGWLKITKFNVPVIVVGNLTVGGTGKTPMVIALVKRLKMAGYFPGIVSRGVGGKRQRTPQIVTPDSPIAEVGDEAILLAQTACPVVIGVHRPKAVELLLQHYPCDVVISDDGLQHYALGRDMEIVMLDAARQLGNGYLLPAGPLREGKQRLAEVDFIISNGSEDFTLEAMDSVSIHKNDSLKLQDFPNKTIHVVVGIGNPNNFLNLFKSFGFTVIPHIFKDHHLYRQHELNFNDGLPIVMTEKDAVKCKQFSGIPNMWYVPVVAKLNETLCEKLMATITTIGRKYKHEHKTFDSKIIGSIDNFN